MGKQLAITVNNKHRIGKKLFITDNNGTYRKGKKAFLTVDGVHRLVYSSGTTWHKYNCTIDTIEKVVYDRVPVVEEVKSLSFWFLSVCGYYTFESSEGFLKDFSTVHTYYTEGEINSANLIGEYIVYNTEVWMILSIDSVSTSASNGRLSVTLTAKRVDQCDIASTDIYHVYSKGSTSYGTVEAEEGALPENGTLVDGSVADGYCILNVDGNLYYYWITDDESGTGEVNDSAELGIAVIGHMKLG
jgi:hypothetical protein